jgi:hypothetical protein
MAAVAAAASLPRIAAALTVLWGVAAKAPPPLIPRMPQIGSTCTLLPRGWPLVPRHAPAPDLTCGGRLAQPLRAAYATFLTRPTDLMLPASPEAPPFTYSPPTHASLAHVPLP